MPHWELDEEPDAPDDTPVSVTLPRQQWDTLLRMLHSAPRVQNDPRWADWWEETSGQILEAIRAADAQRAAASGRQRPFNPTGPGWTHVV